MPRGKRKIANPLEAYLRGARDIIETAQDQLDPSNGADHLDHVRLSIADNLVAEILQKRFAKSKSKHASRN